MIRWGSKGIKINPRSIYKKETKQYQLLKDGKPVRALVMRGRYGKYWAVLDEQDNVVDTVTAHYPTALANKGYEESLRLAPANPTAAEPQK